MTVWVFGASYAKLYENLTDQWTQQIAASLHTDLRNFSIAGSSIEYIYYNFNNNRQDIKDNDIVILPLTTNSRRWFFKDYPAHGAHNVTGTDFRTPKSIYDPTGFPEIDIALTEYEDCLNNHDVFNTYLYNFMMNVDYLTYKKNLKTVVMLSYYDTEYFFKDIRDDFKHLHLAKGKLVDISINELGKDFINNIDIGGTFDDHRINHMIKSNHTILANKILNYVRFNQKVVFDGFVERVVRLDAWTDPEFVKNELFNGVG